jgi:hypothetical protein
MTKDERIQGLLEANNINLEKRRALAQALRIVMEELPLSMKTARKIIQRVLLENTGS